MPRDGAGNYTLPPGINPVVPNTVIEADWANPTLDDIAAAMTDSLSRTGFGGMLVPFKNTDGTVGSPGITWVNEPTSGWYRAALNDFWYSVGNENIFRITKDGIELASGKTGVNLSSFIRVQDDEPVTPPMKQGEEWYESDTGGFYMRYQNPDLTFTYISLAAAGGDFIPMAMRGAANGVASLDAGGKVPAAQLPAGTTTLVATTVLSGQASVSFACAAAAINRFEFELVTPATNAANFLMRVSTDGGATFHVAGYTSARFNHNSAGVSAAGGGAAQAEIFMAGSVNNSGANGLSGCAILRGASNGTKAKQITFDVGYLDSSSTESHTDGSGNFGNTLAAITNVQFIFSAGALASGTIRHYAE